MIRHQRRGPNAQPDSRYRSEPSKFTRYLALLCTAQYRDAGLFRSEMSAVDNNLVNISTTRISFYTTL